MIDNLTFRTSRKAALRAIALGVVNVVGWGAVSLFLVSLGNVVFGAALFVGVALFFGAFTALALARLLMPDAYALHVDDDGMSYRGMFRMRRVGWGDCPGGFVVFGRAGGSQIAWSYPGWDDPEKDAKHEPPDGRLPVIYDIGAAELAALLNARRDRFWEKLKAGARRSSDAPQA